MVNNHKRFQKMLVQLNKELTRGNSLNNRIEKELERCTRVLYKHSEMETNNIVHAIASLIMTWYMLKRNYFVIVEKPLLEEREKLVCDIFCKKGETTEIIEVENTNIPSDRILRHNITPEEYLTARLIGKIARYGRYSTYFDLAFSATPALNMDIALPVLKYFHQNLRSRDINNKIQWLAEKANVIYTNPVIEEEQIANARLDNVYIINVTKKDVVEVQI